MPYTGTQARLSAGTKLYIENAASPPEFVKIGEVADLSGLGNERQLVNVTNLESETMEYIGGLADGAQVDIPMNCVQTDAGQALCQTAYSDGLERNFRVEWSDGYFQTFRGVVLAFIRGAAVNDAVKRTLRLKLNSDLSAEQAITP